MAAPSITYTFSNGTTADADQVNTNFSNILAGLTTGSTWDIAALSLTCAKSIITVVNAADNTKTFTWDLSGATTGTSMTLTSSQTAARVITLPDATDTLVGRATTDTLTNKTLTSPTLTTPVLGTPSSGTLTNCTGLPISTGVSGLAAGIADFLATPSSANLKTAVTDETGSGSLVFATSPTLVTPLLGTPTSGTLTNCTGLPVSTGISGLGSNVATFLATPSSANLATAITDETGSGALVFGTSPRISSAEIGGASNDGTDGYLLLKSQSAAPSAPSGSDMNLFNEGGVLKYRDASNTVTLGTGLTNLNGATGNTQTFAVGTSGTDFAISTATNTHTFNIPSASASARGLVTTGTQTITGAKTLDTSLTITGSSGNVFVVDSPTFVIDATNGRIGMGVTNPAVPLEMYMASTGAHAVVLRGTGASGTQYFIQFKNDGGTSIGQIYHNGTNTVYDTTSDKRLKDNIKPLENSLEKIMEMSPCSYNFDGSEERGDGFLAQDLYNVYKFPVTVGGDDPREKPWGIDYSKLTPILVSAMQEQQKQIEELREKIKELTTSG